MVLEGAVMVLAGILVALLPLEFIRAFSIVIGIILLVVGVMGLFRVLRSRRRSPISPGMAGPILALLLGLLLLFFPMLVPSLLVTILGVFLLMIGVGQLLFGFMVGRGPRATSIKAAGVIGIVLGILVLVFTKAALLMFALFFGIVLAFNGAMTIASGWRVRRGEI